jgi:hypothetical protein
MPAHTGFRSDFGLFRPGDALNVSMVTRLFGVIGISMRHSFVLAAPRVNTFSPNTFLLLMLVNLTLTF